MPSYLVPFVAAVALTCVWRSEAQAEVDLTGAAFTAAPAGDISAVAGPNVSVQAAVRYRMKRLPLSLGLIGEQSSLSLNSQTSFRPRDTLQTRTVGARITLDHDHADVRDLMVSYVGIDAGPAMFGTERESFLSGSNGQHTDSSTGFYVAGELGIRMHFNRHFGYGLAARYEYARPIAKLTAADQVTNQVTRVGFAWQLFFSL